MADEYGVVGGRRQKTYSGADDPEAGNRGQAALDAEARQRKLAQLAAKGTPADDGEPEPQAKDFGGNLAKWSAAKTAWRARRSNPQAGAVKSMMDKQRAD